MMDKIAKRLHEKMNYRPVLIIGLGGVGTNIVRHTLRWIKHMTGQKEKLQPFIKILCFDTDSQASGDDKLPYLLEDVQFFNLGGFSAGRLLNAANDRPDDPDLTYLKPFNEAQLKPGQIHRGAHGIPRIGRLCYAYNRNKRVIPVLTQAILELLDLTLPSECDKEGYPLHSGNLTPTIHFISSVCGGTGAGIMLDIALDVRQLVLQYSNNDPDMIAHLVLPPVFQSQSNPLSQMHQRNAYYLLRQIDYLMGGNRLGKIFISASNMETSELRKYEILYDTIYIINRRLQNKTNTEKHIGRMIAALCLEPLGLDINSMWDNIRMGRIDADPVQVYCGYGFKSYRSPHGYIDLLMCNEFLTFLNNNIFDVEYDKMKDDPARKYIESFSEDKLCKPSITGDQVIQAGPNWKGLKGIKESTDADDKYFEKEFWKTTIQEMQSNDIGFLPMLLQYAKSHRQNLKDKMKKSDGAINNLSTEIASATSAKGGQAKDKYFVNMAKAINEYNPIAAKSKLMKYLEDKSNILAGSGIKTILKNYLEELERTVEPSEGFINMDIIRAIRGLNKGSLGLPESIWMEEYISLVENLLWDDGKGPKKAVKNWMTSEGGFISRARKHEAFVQYEKNFIQSLSMYAGEMRLQLEHPSIEPYMLFDIAGGSGVDTLTFLQSSLHSNQVCSCSKNCDWILCKMHMGIQLNHLKDFETGYYNAFKQAYCKQKSLWGKPLFDIECDKSKQEIEEHISKRIFKIREKCMEGNSGEE